MNCIKIYKKLWYTNVNVLLNTSICPFHILISREVRKVDRVNTKKLNKTNTQLPFQENQPAYIFQTKPCHSIYLSNNKNLTVEIMQHYVNIKIIIYEGLSCKI